MDALRSYFSSFAGPIALIFLLVGCDDTATPETENSAPQLLHSFVAGTPDDVEPTMPSELSSAERKRNADQRHADFRAFEKAVSTAAGWKEADRRVRALLEESSPVPHYRREQVAADWMFKEWLLQDKSSSKKQKAIAFYTNLMIENRNPQAQVIQPALQRLEGHWSESHIAEAAGTAFHAADKFVQSTTYQSMQRSNQTVAAGAETEEAQQTFTNSTSRRQSQLMEAIDRLEAMSKSAQ